MPSVRILKEITLKSTIITLESLCLQQQTEMLKMFLSLRACIVPLLRQEYTFAH